MSRSGDNRHYEVINAGVPGWNLENELAYLQAEGLKYEPDLILLGYYARQRYQGQKCTAGRQSAGSNQMAPFQHLFLAVSHDSAALDASPAQRSRSDRCDRSADQIQINISL